MSRELRNVYWKLYRALMFNQLRWSGEYDFDRITDVIKVLVSKCWCCFKLYKSIDISLSVEYSNTHSINAINKHECIFFFKAELTLIKVITSKCHNSSRVTSLSLANVKINCRIFSEARCHAVYLRYKREISASSYWRVSRKK